MIESYEASAIKTARGLKPEDEAGFKQAMQALPDGRYLIRVEKEKRSRSHRQNRFWWGQVIPRFVAHCASGGLHYTDEEMHEILKLKLNPQVREFVDPVTGVSEDVKFGGSTRAMTTQQFNRLIEEAQQLGSEWGLYIPDPNERAA